ncbi:MAG: YidC/Oxa1 family membrane protein insertase [Parcubacteria group bacterium]|nr:YidC/Oxa1 family membrane protein insertase [Parcubacteria group bacterium]MCR4342805.1 YidC/Oxa1 family membrane protein insertase [Patescibacteria group bacterium]
MTFLKLLYISVFYEPLYNGLAFLANLAPFGDIGIAIIALTLVVKFILFPFSHKTIVTQLKMRKLEPEISALKEKHKEDKQEQAKKVMSLYREHGINPMSGFLMLLIQLPIIFALYKVFLNGLSFNPDDLYYFISVPDNIRTSFLGIFDLTQKSYILAGFAAITQFFQMRLATPPLAKKDNSKKSSFQDDFARSMNIQMRYIMPLFVFFIAFKFSSAIALYWTTMNIFAIVHEILVRFKAKKMFLNGDSKGYNKKNNRGTSFENDNRGRD